MSKAKPKLSDEPQSPDVSIGHELTETVGKKKRTGTAIEWEYTGSTIRNMKTGEQWPGFRFRIQGKRGSEWWSATYADKTKPMPKSLPDLLNALNAINQSKAHAASYAGHLGPYIITVRELIAKGAM